MVGINTRFNASGVETRHDEISTYNLTNPQILTQTIFSSKWPADTSISDLVQYYENLWEQNRKAPITDSLYMSEAEFEKFLSDIDFARFLLSYKKFLVEKLIQLRNWLENFNSHQETSFKEVESQCLKAVNQISEKHSEWEFFCLGEFRSRKKRGPLAMDELPLYDRVLHLTNSLNHAFYDLFILSQALQEAFKNSSKLPQERQIDEILSRQSGVWPRSLNDIRDDLSDLDELASLFGLGDWEFADTFKRVIRGK